MKKLIALCLGLIICVTGCGYRGSSNGNETTNDSSRLCNQQLYTSESNDDYIRYEIIGNKLQVSGQLSKTNANYVWVQYEGEASDEQKPSLMNNGCFLVLKELPNRDLTVNLFCGESETGVYNSLIIDFVMISNTNNQWQFVSSPTLEANKKIYNSQRENISEYEKSTEYIQSDSSEIIQLSNSIVLGVEDEYKKLLLIHDWIAENIYYDLDSFSSGIYKDVDSLNVLYSKKAVCEGYANLFAALVRAQGIPCMVRNGYALGIGTKKKWTDDVLKNAESNHAWNEAYIDERWVIVDSTWDSKNKIENGNMIKGESIDRIYFDSNIEFFSLSHKIIE